MRIVCLLSNLGTNTNHSICHGAEQMLLPMNFEDERGADEIFKIGTMFFGIRVVMTVPT